MGKKIEIMSGYDLVRRVLEHEHGGVETLLSLSGNDESKWLELKAGMDLLPDDVKKGETQKDLYWNIAKAVIALANTCGGVVAIGIQNETHELVPLQSNDPRHVIERSGLDAYLRQEILDRIWPEKKIWKTKNGTWEIQDHVPENLVELRKAPYRGDVIAVILVKPIQSCVKIWEGKIEQILIRDGGEVGHVKPILGSTQMMKYETSERQIEAAYFASLYDKFLRETEKTSEDGFINQAIEQYYLNFKEKKNDCFISLDGIGFLTNNDEDDFMEPKAIEIFEPDEYPPSDKDNSGKTDDSEEDDEGEDEDDGENREQRSGDLISLMQEIPRMVVLGEPGGGKTTTLIRFCTLFVPKKDQSETTSTLAVYIRMANWKIDTSIGQLLCELTLLSSEQWLSLIRQNRLRLVIDAFNECPDQYKNRALGNIQSFLRQYADVPIVISARTDEDLKSLNLPMFSVQPMDQDHQLRYLIQYLKDEAKAKDLLTRLAAMSGGTSLAANPMLLKLVVDIFKVSHSIPSGRAKLYSQWLRYWYNREYGKAENARNPLPWDFDEALKILSELALQGRLQGFRDIPIEFAKKILQGYEPDCIEKLCQGPVITIDEDFIRFRHETFQEYLCAEKLIRQPNRLAQVAEKDYTQWPMVLAYAAELQWPLPEPLWLFAWKINPWLGIALTDEKRVNEITDDNYTGPRPEYREQPVSFVDKNNDLDLKILYHALTGSWDGIIDDDFSKPRQPIWNQLIHISKIIEYILLTKKDIKRRWTLFELWQICRSNGFGSFCASYPSFIAVHSDSLSKQCTLLDLLQDYLKANYLPNDLKSILEKQIFHFSEEIQNNISVHIILFAIKNRIIKKEDFAEKIPAWIQMATPEQAIELINLRIATREDFAANIPEWVHTATPGQVIVLINMRLATREDFAEKITAYVQMATPGQAIGLINLRLATREDFAAKIPEWIQQATPKVARQLITREFATREDFAAKIPEWIQQANPNKLQQLINAGFATREDFAAKIPEWIRQATPRVARQLINAGLVTHEDFAAKISEWIQIASPNKLQQLINLRLVTREDFSTRIQTATVKQAIQFIQAGLATPDDFATKIPEWIKKAPPNQAQQLINTGLATRKDFIQAATVNKAIRFIQIGLASPEDFAAKDPEWIQDAPPEVKRQLINVGLVSKFQNAVLKDLQTRQRYSQELAGIEWRMTVCQSTSQFSFFKHPAFQNDVFCPQYILKAIPKIGSIWSVKVSVRPDKKKQSYGFCVINAKQLSDAKESINYSLDHNALPKTRKIARAPEGRKMRKITRAIVHNLWNKLQSGTPKEDLWPLYWKMIELVGHSNNRRRSSDSDLSGFDPCIDKGKFDYIIKVFNYASRSDSE